MAHLIRLSQFFAIGYASFGAKGYLEHSKSFNPKALDVDLSGRNIIVTGATSGLGKITARELAQRKANIHLVVRNLERGEKIKEEILASLDSEGIKQTSEIKVHECDVSSLKDINELSKYFIESKTPIHVLINNAGVMKPKVMKSKDDLELAFATNTLGTYTLTEMLIPCLEIAQPNARVINISSGGMLTEKLEINDLEGKSITKSDGSIDGPAQYSRCKRRQVALAEYWSNKYRKEQNKNIFFASMHPGWADTPGLKHSMSQFYNFTQSQLRTEDQGADTIVYLAAVDDVSSLESGAFYFDRMPASKHFKLGGTRYNDSETEKLADKLNKLVQQKGYTLPN